MEAKVEEVKIAVDETSSTYYFDLRKAAIEKLEAKGHSCYPHKFNVTMEFGDFKTKYEHLAKSEQVDDVVVQMAGRITSKRSASSKLFFYDVFNDGHTVQIIANFGAYKEQDQFTEVNDWILKRGDIVGVVGIPARSKSGELSVIAHKLILLSPCYHNLPHPNTLTDMETRYRCKYLDLMVNTNVAEIFKTRAKVIKFIRNFFDDRGYVEVETPMLNIIPGGANAAPFLTHHNDLHTNMFLRIAPELYLKQLIIGGLNKVYEIGKNFRNEGVDLTHNPEYTSCENYTAYADADDTMRMTEELLSSMVLSLTGGYVIPYTTKTGEKCTVDFTPPFKRFPLIQTLEERLKVKFPADLASIETNNFLKILLTDLGVVCSEPLTTPRLIDKLVGEYIECDLVNPGFITEHPIIMSPLAKWHRSKIGLTERFELFIAKFEVCNAYLEQNQPFKQRECFLSQQKDREGGDDESQPIDEPFCVALEHALPPTAGWGIGIDRLVMLLTNQSSIKEVIAFPTMRPTESDRRAQKQMSSTLEYTLKAMAEAIGKGENKDVKLD